MTEPDANSKRTRVEPVFSWLREHGGGGWPERFLQLTEGLSEMRSPGRLCRIDFEAEHRVAPSARRLAWMIRNVELLAPRDGKKWREYRRRIIDNPRKAEALEKLDRGITRGLDPLLKLEGSTAADCLIECERAVIWVEGKRNDWLDYSTTWDLTRDQLSRNTEAAWLYSAALGKDFNLVVCHEYTLKHHEELLVAGYRSGTWIGGWPHLTREERENLAKRIGTLRWSALASEWPLLRAMMR